ncbi:MAG: DUF2807 domain-containing protein [Mariniphaga sp.]|nr:DUF2807 domain-containing protein [Mariniphaga sp.]
MRIIKLFTLLLATAAVFQSVTLQASRSDNGRQTRQLSGFHGISVSSGIDLSLTQKNVEEVFVEANSDDLDKIITKVEDGILKIYIKDKSWFGLNWNKELRKVYVSFKNLDKLDASAGSDVNSSSVLKLDKLDLDVSSGSDVRLELDARQLRVNTSSGSDVSLNGKAQVADFSASSGSDIKAGDLETIKCSANVSSGSDISINVTEELNAEASSGGGINYSGSPKVKNIRKSSGGDVDGR